jgi:hypothetical protein
LDADAPAGGGTTSIDSTSAAVEAGTSEMVLVGRTAEPISGGSDPRDAKVPLSTWIAGAEGCAVLPAVSVLVIRSADKRDPGVPNSTRIAASFATSANRCAGFFLKH